jgi:hypothetical protein
VSCPWQYCGCYKQSSGCYKQSSGCYKQSSGCYKQSSGCYKQSSGCYKQSSHFVLVASTDFSTQSMLKCIFSVKIYSTALPDVESEVQ